MKSKVNNRKLKNYFISKEIQLPIAIAHLAYLVLIAVMLIATVLSPFYTDIFGPGDLTAKHFSAKMFVVMLERLSMASMLIILISFLHFIVFTHKFCGPLVRIGRTIAQIAKGDFTQRITLRKGDFLKPEAQQINDMVRMLSDSVATVKKENALLLDDLDNSIQAHGRQAEIEAELKGLRERAERCQAQLDNFRLHGENTAAAGDGQEKQLMGDSSLSVNKCA